MAEADIRPFPIEVPEADLEDLRERLANTRWTEQERGGHFAAFEEPDAFAADLWEFGRTIRQ